MPARIGSPSSGWRPTSRGSDSRRERAFEIDVVGRRALRQTGALRLLAVLDRLAELHIGAEAAAAQRHLEAAHGIDAELLGADIGRRRRPAPSSGRV